MGCRMAEDKLICRCYGVPESVIRRAAGEHDLRLVEEVTAVTRAGGGCSSCWDEIQALLDLIHGRAPRDVPDASGLTAAQKKAEVAKVVAKELEPVLGLNGIQIQVVDVGADRVLARFYGEAAGTTAASYLALKKHMVDRVSAACGGKMKLVELNALEGLSRSSTA